MASPDRPRTVDLTTIAGIDAEIVRLEDQPWIEVKHSITKGDLLLIRGQLEIQQSQGLAAENDQVIEPVIATDIFIDPAVIREV